ncbi:TVP38/TMEM64 family protein [Desulfomicrobium escambiense]|uniref:TVP38/TMEM64 family protein n=1 Tax=Desulfomicrobium escambiense TaxID=29503 RepID=UPI0004113618|nr:TVP38/TMEM64 family protein [Desulfomicrobium escambiense]
MRKRLWLGLGVLAAVALFFALDLQRFLSLAAVQGSLGALRDAYAEHGPLMVGGYFLCYVLMAALSLPGATVMGLAGGAVFGFWVGTLAVSFASTIGATLAFLMSRYLLRDAVQRRFGDRLAAVNDGVAREGAWYLFTLRLIPVFPFFVINLVMGLTPMPARTFYWVSQLGMLGGTMVYVNAGRELGRLKSLSGILSPSMLLAFALLGLFPLMVKKAVARVRAQKKGRTAPLS